MSEDYRPDPYDTYDVANWASMEEDEGPSLSLIAKWFDEGRTCAECASEFTKANGQPSVCQHCKNQGSDYPLSKHPEKNTEAHKQRARKRRKESKSNG